MRLAYEVELSLAQNQHADVGRERERLRAALAERQSASVAAAAAPAPDASVDALLEAVSTLLIFTSLFAGVITSGRLHSCLHSLAALGARQTRVLQMVQQAKGSDLK